MLPHAGADTADRRRHDARKPQMAIIHSPHRDVQVPDSPLTSYVFRRMDDHRDKAAYIDGPTGRRMTFQEVYGAAGRLAGSLQRGGLAKSDVLALLAPNLPEYAVVFHGTLLAGGTVTTINPTYTAGEVKHQLVDAGARVLVTIAMFLGTALEAARGTKVDTVIVIGEVPDDAPTELPVSALREHLTGDPVDPAATVDPAEDLAVLPYSSGTTGTSKGVMLTHTNLAVNLAQAEASFDLDAEDVIVAVLPFFHIYGMNLLMNAGLDRGMTTITMPRFDLEQFLALVQQHQVSVAFLVPPIVLALAKHPVVDNYDLSSLRLITSGAAPLGEDTAAEAAQRIGCSIIQGYGMTELSPLTHLLPTDSDKVGAIGPAVPNTECRIVSPETGEDLGSDEDGELWIRGPQVMKGYLNNEAATAATITDDGWLRTGDIGHVDADGDFWIVDRLKELIKVKGFQVAPAELEELLLSHPQIADAAVIGVPDTEAGERPKAFVVTRPDADLDEAAVRSFVSDRVATYKQIHAVDFIDEVPKSASGKILRRVLSDRESG